MNNERALKELSDAEELMNRAYEKMMQVSKECPKELGYPLKDVIISLGTATLCLVLVKCEYEKEANDNK
jgi:hypothetical protein